MAGTRTKVVCPFVITFLLGLSSQSFGVPLKGSRVVPDLTAVDWNKVGQKELENTLAIQHRPHHPKNVIFVVGDGMGLPTLTAARIFKSQQRETSLVETSLAWEDFPYTALAKTYTTNHLNGDSAATATAYLSGVKTNKAVLGLTAHVQEGDCEGSKGQEVESILHHSHNKGKWTGLISTSSITDATPGALYSHTADRKWECDADMEGVKGQCKDIASQLVEDNNFMKVVLAGGRQWLLPETEADPEYPDDASKRGRRKDNQNLIKKWQELQVAKDSVTNDTVKFVHDLAGFNAVDVDTVEYLLGLFEADNMQYESDREDESVERGGEPSIAHMVEAAISVLQRGPQGYFLFVEAGRIDHGHHATMANKALLDTLALDEAVDVAKKMTSAEDTLIVVTADHSHVFTLAAPPVGYDIRGLHYELDGSVSLAQDGLPYMPMGYTNGPGFIDHRTMNSSLQGEVTPRKNLTDDQDQFDHKNYRQDASYPLRDESHGSEDVAVYARGPMQHLFVGTHEQNYIAHALMYASCVGPHTQVCEDKENSATSVATSSHFIMLLTGLVLCHSLIKGIRLH